MIDMVFSLPEVVAVVRCKDCKYWRDRYIRENDGRIRQYKAEDLKNGHYVSSDVGVNVGAMCEYDKDGWAWDHSVFREADDYCSRGIERPCSYEEWWGIKDGYYPKGAE